ncbi:hypothetical protein HY091_02645 [Candidatus Kaiserbacteria bacterium]|nr:hypothetical protein [Candidatus Kaiserbacteria bacterium]
MIDPELAARLDTLEQKIDAAYRASEKVRKYLFWTGVVTIVIIVLPIIGLVFAIPAFLNNYVAPINNLSGGGANAPSVQDTVNTLNSLGL